MTSDEHGEILETPQASEVYEKLPEPDKGKPKSEKVRLWEARITVARKIREKKFKDLNVLIDFYEGLQWHNDINMPVLQDKTTVNLIFANIKKELPYLYFQNPTPTVNARRPEFELQAFALQELLKFYAKYNMKTELKKHVRLCILDAKFSFGCLKTTYTPRFGANPKKGKPAIAGQDEFGNPIFVVDENGNILAEPDEILLSEMYYIERISPREVLIDPNCRNFIEQANWVGHEVTKKLSYLKNNPLYKNTESLSRNVELTGIFKDTLNKTSEEQQAVKELYGDDNELVRGVEIYDFENSELLFLPDDYHSFIREEKITLSPFSFLKFNEKPDEWYPVSDVAQEKPLQQEVNVGRSLMITHARRSARKYFYSEDTFRGIDDAEGLNAMKDPEDMTLVKVAEYDKPPSPVQMATQDPAVFSNLYQSRMDYNEVAGSTEASRGVTERRKTMGESQFQESHGAVRRSDKQSLVADFIVDTYINLAELMQETMTIPQAIKVIGNAGIFWTKIDRKNIQGEFLYDIEISDLRPQIPEIERAELSEFIFALSNFLNSVLANPVGPMVFNIQGIVKEFAKSYPSLKVENILNMQVTPQQIAQAAMMQLQQGGKNGEAKGSMAGQGGSGEGTINY